MKLKSHVHRWKRLYKNIVGEFRKGVREIVRVRGHYDRCQTCKDGRFVPLTEGQSIVGCEMVTEHA